MTSVLVAVLAATVALLASSTAGRSDASRRAVLDTVDGLGSALVVVSDVGAEPVLDGRFVAAVEGVEGVTWAFGLGPVVDVANAALQVGAVGVPLRPVVGGLPAELELRAGRLPVPGEAWVGERAQAALRMAVPAGSLATADARVAVVGGYTAAGPLDRLADLALVVPEGDPAGTRLLHVYVRAEGPESVAAVAEAVRSLLPADGADGDALDVETSAGVVALREALAERLDRDALVLLATVLACGVVVSFVVTWMSTLARRTDLGRRRALGSTRSAAVVIVVLHTGLAALGGAAIGVAAGAGIAAQAAGRAPGAGFLAAVLVLTVLSTVAGCVVPAVAGARSDPVRVLRVP
ncbi:FtsX-like permease family protein [Cellulomonas sp. Marseille-Q8402]